jgi:hypothetical protein
MDKSQSDDHFSEAPHRGGGHDIDAATKEQWLRTDEQVSGTIVENASPHLR